MTEPGIFALINRLLECKTKKAANAYIDKDVGVDYKTFARMIADRLSYPKTTNQNNFSFAWYTEAGHALGETPLEVRCRAKLDIGCVILCRDDPKYLEACTLAMGHLDRETRLEKMMPYWPVTRLMTTKQMTEYMNTFERQHRGLGIDLSQPKDAA